MWLEPLEPRLLLTDVGGHIVADTLWDNTDEPYVMVDDVFIDPGVHLQLAPGVEVHASDYQSIFVDGWLQAAGASLYLGQIGTNAGGRTDLTGCDLSGTWVWFDSGAAGSVTWCYQSAPLPWYVDLGGSAVFVTDSTGLGEAYLGGTGGLRGCTVGGLELYGGAPVVENSIIEGSLLISDPDVILDGLAGNTYLGDGWFEIGGTLDASRTLAPADGLSAYVIRNSLTVAAGASLSVDPAATLSTLRDDEATIYVEGTFTASGQQFRGATFVVADGGTLSLADCDLQGATVVVEAGGTAELENCYGSDDDPWCLVAQSDLTTIAGADHLYAEIYAAATITDSDIVGLEVRGGAPAVQGCTIAGYIDLRDPAADLSGITGNTYVEESPAIRLLDCTVTGDVTLGEVDGIGRYVVSGTLTIASGGSLATAPGVTLTTGGHYCSVRVWGTLATTGGDLENASIEVTGTGRLELAGCMLANASVGFEEGAGGVLDGCYGGGEQAWSLQVSSDDVTVNNCTEIGYAYVAGSAVLQNNDLWALQLAGGSPTVTGNRIFESILLSDPDTDLAGVSSNEYPNETSEFRIMGVLDASRSLSAADGISTYTIVGPLGVGPGATLSLEPGVTLRRVGIGTSPITVNGTLALDGTYLQGAIITVTAGGRLDLANAMLGQGGVGFAAGSAGRLQSCYGSSSWKWTVSIASPDVEVTGCSNLSTVVVAAAATVTGNTLETLQWNGGAATIQGNYLTGLYPVRITDPDVDTSGYTGNTYQYGGRSVYICGVLDGTATLAPLGGASDPNRLTEYRLNGQLTVAPGASLTVGPAVTLDTYGTGTPLVVEGQCTIAAGATHYGNIRVTGTLYAEAGASLLGGQIEAFAGGRIELTGCNLNGPDVYFREGSSGLVADCNLDNSNGWWLYVYSDDVTVTNSRGFWLETNASETISECLFPGLAIYGGRPTIERCTLTSRVPIAICGPGADFSGFSDNTYTEPDLIVELDMAGNALQGDLVLSPVEGISRFRLTDNLTIASGATLTIPAGAELTCTWGTITVQGTLAATGARLEGLTVVVEAGGRADFAGCTLVNCRITYQGGAAGAIASCQAAQGSSWSVESAADGFSLASSTGIDHVTISGDAQLTDNTFGYLTIAGGTLTGWGNTITDERPVRILDPDLDLTGFVGNMYTATEPLVTIGGTLDGARTLGSIDTLTQYLLAGNLKIGPAGALDLAPGVGLLTTFAESGDISVSGSLVLSGVTFNGTSVTVADGGSATLTGCTFRNAPPLVGQSADDLWDVRRGASITGYYTSPLAGSSLDNFLGGTGGTVEPGITLLTDSFGAGFVHWIQWRTPDVVTLRQFKLYAQGDSPWSTNRTFNYFRLLAADPATGVFYTVYETAVQTPYGTPYPSDPGLLLHVILPAAVAARDFRAEFRQASNTPYARGPRIIELDGYSQGLGRASLLVRSGGTLNVVDTVLDGTTVTYEAGAVGQLLRCSTDDNPWSADVGADDVTVSQCSGGAVTTTSGQPHITECNLDSVTVSGTAAPLLAENPWLGHVAIGRGATAHISTSTLGLLSIAGPAAPTVEQCVFTDMTPVRLGDPNVDLSSLAGNTWRAGASVLLSGEVQQDVVLGALAGPPGLVPLSRYQLAGELTVEAGASLTVGPGAELSDRPFGATWHPGGEGGGYDVVVRGYLAADGAVLDARFIIADGGQADFAHSTFLSGSVTFAGGEGGDAVGGTIEDCSGTWSLYVYGGAVSIVAPLQVDELRTYQPLVIPPGSTVGQLVIGAAVQTTGSTIGWIGIEEDAQPQISGCTITDSLPLRLHWLGADLAGIAGNVYTSADPRVLISGSLYESMTLGSMCGLDAFFIEYLAIWPGAQLTIPAGTAVALSHYAAIYVYGTLSAEGVEFAGGAEGWLLGMSGGTVNLNECLLGTTVLQFNSGSGGTISRCVLGKLYIDSGSTAAVHECDLAGSHVWATGSSSATIDLEDNWWGTVDPAAIAAKIEDHADASWRPYVDADPFLTSPPVCDTTGPRVLASAALASQEGQQRAIRVTFSEAIDTAAVVLADLWVTGPGGTSPITGVSWVSLTTYDLIFDAAPDGQYQLHVGPGVPDLAGNLLDQDSDGAAGETNGDDQYEAPFVLDVHGPSAPGSLAFAVDTGISATDGRTNDTLLDFTWTAADDVSGVARYEYRWDAGPWTPTTGLAASVGASEGDHVFAVRAVDPYGNVGAESSLAVTVDLTGPVVGGLVMSPDTGRSASDFVTAAQAPVFSWDPASDPSGMWRYQYRYDGGAWTDTAETSVQQPLAHGSHTFAVRAIDGVGNAGPAASVMFLVDTAAPAAPSGLVLSADRGGSSSDFLTSDNTPTITWGGVYDISGIWRYEYRLDGGAWQETAAPSCALDLAEGSYLLEVRAVDVAGNVGAASARTITIDVTPPSAAPLLPPAVPHTPVSYVDLEFSERIVPATVNAANLSLTGPSGPIAQPHFVVTSLGGNVYRVAFDEQRENGSYTLAVGPGVADWAGAATAATIEAAFDVQLPDLMVLNAWGDDAGWAGSPVTVNWTVTNTGTFAAGGAWTDAVYASADAALDGSDILLTTLPASGLAPGASYDRTASVTLPMVDWVRYLLVRTDSGAAVVESVESNNVGAHAISVSLANLEATDFVAPAAGTVGQMMHVEWQVSNTGAAPAEGVWQDGVYLSADEHLDPGDRLLVSLSSAGISPLAAGRSYRRVADFAMPANVTPGTYYLLFAADGTGAVPEGDETDNVLAVAPFAVRTPDLRVIDVSVPDSASTGEPILVEWSVWNAGDGGTGTAAWTDRVYLSPFPVFNSTWTFCVGGIAGPRALDAGDGYEQSLVVVPNASPGLYYLFVMADAGNQVAEAGGEANNLSPPQAIQILPTPQPDLVVAEISVAALPPQTDIVSGQQVTVTWTVENTGQVATTATCWTDAVYLTHGDVFGQPYTLLGTFAHTGHLLPGGQQGDSYTRTETVVLPEGISGTWYIWVGTDENNDVYEDGGETNNRRSAAVNVVLQPTPDLQVLSVAADDGISGQAVRVTWTVANAGTGTLAGAWHDALLLSSDAAYNPGSDTFLGSFAVSGILPPGGQYERTEYVTLPDLISGPFYIIVVTDSGRAISEYQPGAENNNAGAGGLTVTFVAPDLVPTVTSAPASGVSGQTVTVSWRVENAGAGGTRSSAWTDRLYLSADEVLDPGSDVLLGTVPHTGELEAGGGYDASLTAALPQRLQGRWHLILQTDAGSQVTEGDGEANNAAAAWAIDLVLPPTPNLQPVITAPALAFPTLPVTASWTVTNTGAVATPETRWYDYLYLSRDASLDTTADNVLIGRFDHGGQLGVEAGIDDRYTITTQFTVPGGTGTYYVIVVTDAADEVFENLGETDNVAVSGPMTVRSPVADLAVSNVIAPTTGWTGRTVRLSWVVTNLSDEPTDMTGWYDRVLLSEDPAPGNDILLAQVARAGALGPGASYQPQVDLGLPSTPGTYYVLVVADAEATVADTDRSNNTAASAGTIVVIQTPPPDLVPSAVAVHGQPRSGEPLTVSWTVTNVGASATPASWWTDSVILSGDEVLGGPDDVVLGSAAHYGSLAQAASYSQTLTVTLPDNLGGSHTLFVVTDASSRVAEGDAGESNNAAAVAMDVTLVPPPDLRVASVEVDPSPALAGLGATVRWTVVNDSTTATRQDYWRDRVYLSADETLDPASDRVLGTFAHNGRLAAGQSYSAEQSVVIPEECIGAYYVLVMTDVDNLVPEYQSEGNNLGLADLQTAARPWPDLWATNVTVDRTGGTYANQSVRVSWTVYNGGPWQTDVANWIDAVYLSLDEVLQPASDVYLGSLSHSGALAPYTGYSASLWVTLPASFAGDYWVFVKADAWGNVPEGSAESNNADYDHTAVTISAAPRCDLVISDVAGPVVGVPGGPATISYTVTNASSQPTVGQWWDAVYLSKDDVWDTQDALVTRISGPQPLDAGASRAVTAAVSLPALLPGQYFLIVRTDIYNNIAESDGGGENNNTAVAAQRVHLQVPPLTLDTQVEGTLTQSDPSDCWVVEVAPGKNLALSLQASGGWNELYVARGRIATQYDFDARAAPRTTNVELVVSGGQTGGTFYVTAYGRQITGSQTSYILRADDTRMRLTSVGPTVQGNGADDLLVIEGVGFDPSATVSLVSADGAVYQASEVRVLSAEKLLATFAARTLPAGTYDLRVSQTVLGATETAEQAGAVRIVEGGTPLLDVHVSVPGTLGYHQEAVIWVEYSNRGEVAMEAPLLVLQAVQKGRAGALLTLDASNIVPGRTDYSVLPPGYAHSVHILASGQMTGLLLPGETCRVPVYYSGWLTPWDFTYPPIQFSVGIADADEPIDWVAVEKEILSAPPNPYVWPQVCSTFGQTWGDYTQTLIRMARYLDDLGYRTYDGRELFKAVFNRVRGMGSATASGRVFDARTGQPVSGVELVLRSDAPDGIIRSTTTDADGHFTFERLIDDRYEIIVAGYETAEPFTLTILRERSVSGLLIQATPVPVETPIEATLLESIKDPFLLDVEGVPHLAMVRNGRICISSYAGGAWAQPAEVPGAEGREPKLLYSPTLIDGTQPGIALLWRSGEGNRSRIMLSVGRSDGAGGWDWSEPVVYASGEVGAIGHSATIDPTGRPVVVWQMVGQSNADDPDLYYSNRPVVSTELSWDHVLAIVKTDQPIGLPGGAVLPQGSLVAFMDDGQAWVVGIQDEPCTGQCDPNWGFEMEYEFPAFKKGFNLPSSVPYIGGKNEVEFEGSIETHGNLEGAGGTGKLSGSAEFLGGRVEGSIEGSIGLAWKLDRYACQYVFDQAKIAGKVGIEGKIPIPQLTWNVAIGKAEIGLVVGGEISGELIFKAGPEGDYGRKPLGGLTGHLYLGIYGEAEILFGYLAKAEAKGTGNIEIKLDGDGLRLSDIYLQFEYEVVLGCVLKISGEIRWPEESPLGAASMGSLDDLLLAIQDGQPAPALSLYNAPGTGNVYGDHPVLANVAQDYSDDGMAALVTGADGLVYAFWPRETDDWNTALGSNIVWATFDGSSWSAPQTIGGSCGFNATPAVAVDADGHIVIAWARGDSTGLTSASDPEAVYDAMQSSDVWTAELTESGWSAPVRVADLAGEARFVSIGTDADGQLRLVWGEGGSDAQNLYVASWDGSAWSAPTLVADGIFLMSPATVAVLDGQTALVWAQGLPPEDGSGALPEESRLYTAAETAGAWSGPAELVFGQGALASQAATETVGTQDFSFHFTLGTKPPKGCCCGLADAPDAPNPFLDEFWRKFSRMVGSVDPNDKIGPSGYGDAGFVAIDRTLSYEIHFENMPDATAPAQRITITDTLDPDLDPYSLEFTELVFGNHRITVPDGLAYYKTAVDLRPDGVNAIAEIEMGLNLQTHQVVVVLNAVDPDTGLPPPASVGLLPPNDETGRGEGHVSYRVRPLDTAATGTVITNQARIVFDLNAPIDTPVVNNTVDADAPSSAVAPLPDHVPASSFEVAWAGSDGQGSGIAAYDVYVSINGGPFVPWLQNTTQTSAIFQGEPNHQYAFYCRARDNVGLYEAAPAAADAATATPVAPTVVGWFSAAMHKGVEELLPIPAAGGAFSEPRAAGLRVILVEFSEPIEPASLTPASVSVQGTYAGGQTVDLGPVSVSTALRPGNTVAEIAFSAALPDAAWYRIALSGVTDTDGYALYGDADCIVSALVGDVTGDRVVNSADLDALRNLLGARPGSANWNPRADLDGDGWVSTRDWRIQMAADGHSSGVPPSQQQSPPSSEEASQPPATPAPARTDYEALGDLADDSAGAALAVLDPDGAAVQTWTAWGTAGLQSAADVDWFRLVAPASGTLLVDAAWADPLGLAGRPWVALYELRTDASGAALFAEAAGPGEASTVAVGRREYYVEVRAADGSISQGVYDLTIRLAQFDEYLSLIRVDEVLADTDLRGSGYSVAVIDTGVDYRNADLAGRVILGPDLADRDADPMDTVGHGTQVAGLIASHNPYAPGVAPDAQIIAIKVTPDGSTATSIELIGQALAWVLQNQTRYNIVAISLSLGGGCVAKGETVEQIEGLYQQLAERGVFISVAAGNGYAAYGSREGLSTLAASPSVAAVGAVWDEDVGPASWTNGARDYSTGQDRIVSFSQRDAGLDLLAPGGDILGLKLGGGLTTRSGTSMAAPLAAGAAVLVREAAGRLGLNLGPKAILADLAQTGRRVYDGDDENDNVINTGRTYWRIDVLAAVTGIVRLAEPEAASATAVPQVELQPGDGAAAAATAASLDSGGDAPAPGPAAVVQPAAGSAALADQPVTSPTGTEPAPKASGKKSASATSQARSRAEAVRSARAAAAAAKRLRQAARQRRGA